MFKYIYLERSYLHIRYFVNIRQLFRVSWNLESLLLSEVSYILILEQIEGSLMGKRDQETASSGVLDKGNGSEFNRSVLPRCLSIIPAHPLLYSAPPPPTVIVDDSISLPASATFLLIFLLYSLPPLFYLTFFKKNKKPFLYSPSSAKALKLS